MLLVYFLLLLCLIYLIIVLSMFNFVYLYVHVYTYNPALYAVKLVFIIVLLKPAENIFCTL